MTWNFLGVVPEGQNFKINGINVWSQKWTTLKDEFAAVKRPHLPSRVQIPCLHNQSKR